MIELTHSLNKKMADRYLYDRYDKFSEENLPSEYFSLDDDSIRVDIPQDETKIKKLMDEVMCLIYMEPDNPYNYHTTYASARGFNSNEIVLEIVGNHSRKIFIYNLTQNEFDLISREKCNEVSFVANMYIICNRGKIGRKYGDFGYILSLLDAGHFIENIKCFSIEEKLSFTLDYNPCTSIDMLRLPKPYQIVPLVKLDITDFFVKKQENLWDNENVNKVKFSDTYTGNKSGSLVDQFIDKVLESKVPIVEKFSNIRTSVKVKELLMRTSSQSAQGYSFFPYECPDDVLDEIIDSVKLSLADVTDDLICVQLVMNTDSVRVYEIKRDHVNTNVFNIKGSTEYSVAELLNNPINTDLLDEVWSRYWKLITGNNSIMQFFVQVDEFAYLDEKKKYDCINEFINLNRDAYEMEKWAFFAAVKHVVWDSEIIYVGKTDLEKCFEELNWNSAETLDDSNLKENNLYVINLNEVDAEKIESFERIAVENSLARLYICEDFSHIWIGPALYGNQFGCLMCNDYAKDKMVTNRTPSDLLISLLKIEVIKLFPELIECMMQDNTLSKGKVFTLDKFDMSADQEAFGINVNCRVCAN